jgi:hypothetical protein
MGVMYGVNPTWGAQTNEGRTHIATKGIVQSGLVLNLDAGVSSSYPTTGTTWTDLSGNGNTGTLTNGPTYSSANGGSITFDGVNDYVSTSVFDDVTTNRTFSVWYNPLNNSTNTFPLNRGRDGAGNGWSLMLGSANASGHRYRCGIAAGSPVVGYFTYSTSAVVLNQWVYLTGVWINGSSISLYVNGVFQSSTSVPSGSLRTSTEGWVLGSITTSLFNSQSISQVSIYNRALTPQEIQQNFNATRSRYSV